MAVLEDRKPVVELLTPFEQPRRAIVKAVRDALGEAMEGKWDLSEWIVSIREPRSAGFRMIEVTLPKRVRWLRARRRILCERVYLAVIDAVPHGCYVRVHTADMMAGADWTGTWR